MADQTADNKTAENKVSFKDTLNLPHTDFPIRANPQVDDPAMVARWEQEQLFSTSFDCNAGAQKYILHDGPPYANGHIHVGHAYGKILRDIVSKSQRMLGKHVPVTPGWDCHGLPIEFKVTQETPGMSPEQIKKASRIYAQKWIDIQRQEFKNLGVLMDWDRPYITMSSDYEASILQAFGMFVAGGYIERKNKTVPWCFSCQTVLALAEIEYQERKDPSTYVLFPLESKFFDHHPVLAHQPINFLVWTTTPWTLPLNRAVLIRPGARYVVLELLGKYIITAKQLADKVSALAEAEPKIIAEFSSDELVSFGAQAQHPFVDGLTVPVILDQSVLLEDGTACVHSAPGCGPEDYEVGVRNNLEIYSPLTPDGKYSADIAPRELEGMSITDGQIWVIKKLAEKDRLFFKTSIRHPYPHCWRCHNGLMFRATKQWFCDLERGDLRSKVLQAIDTIVTIPEKSSNSLKAVVEGRLEWCLSRQRVWGVPIPALLCIGCDHTYISQEFVESVASKVALQGIEYWDNVTVQELVPAGFKCPRCSGTEFKKETDILDVWFESGISHYAVLCKNKELGFPADLYLEGKDQHRGWFQSSLLTALVIEGVAPMKTIMTHGFTVDEKGRKMSKSVGNVVSPADMTKQLGTDGLRLWAVSIDCSGDAVISDVLIKNVAEVFRKIRNTSRFLLSNLYDFDIEKDAVSLKDMRLIDQYALQRLYEINEEIVQNYEDIDVTSIFHKLADYCATDLSSFYLDIVKDRLYVEKADGNARRSAQTACWYILDTLTKLTAPILSFTAEQVSDNYQKNKIKSIHLQQFAALNSPWKLIAAQEPTFDFARLANKGLRTVADRTQATLDEIQYVTQKHEQWELIKAMRSALLKAIEALREKGIIKHSLEVRMTIHLDDAQQQTLRSFFADLALHGQSIEEFFKEFLIVSQVVVVPSAAGLQPSESAGLAVLVEKAEGDKCPRCWQWEVTQDKDKLCARCQAIVR